MKPNKNQKTRHGFKQINWLYPIFLAIIPAVLIIWLQPIQFSRLIFEEHINNDEMLIFFEDLENDGKSEKIILGDEAAEGHAFIKYYNDQGKYINQYNFNHPNAKCRLKRKPYAVDLTNDGTKELVFFTQNKDSLFVAIFDYKQEIGIVRNRFITTIGGFNKHLDYYINLIGDYDVNSDSIPELFFSVASGFAWNPRCIFRFDCANNSLISSTNTGAGYLPAIICEHNDSMMLVSGSAAYGNIKADYPFSYHDTTTWLFCFDKDLQLKCPPRNYGSNPSGIEYPLFKDGFIYYLFASNNAHDKNQLFKMNWQGTVVDSLAFDFYASKSFFQLNTNDETHYYLQDLDARQYMRFDFDNFKLLKSEQLKTNSNNQILYERDLNNDKLVELITINPLTRDLNVFNHKLKLQNTLKLSKYTRFISSHYSEDRGFGELAICGDDFSTVYRYYENPNFHYKYPLWLGIYILSAVFMLLVILLQNKRLLRQQNLEKQLANLQLQNLQNQLDPHFTFNILNSVGNAIYKQDKEAAYDLFQRFTRIIRSSLMSSDKALRTLKEELQFTEDYLEFQKLRFKDRFNFKITIQQGLNIQYLQFPKMLLQGFAENAVKHAFYGIKHTGLISISLRTHNNQLEVSIEDNGIGITQSQKLKHTSGTQKGLPILTEQVKQTNRLFKTNYSITIIDKGDYDNGENGTKVIISSRVKN